jgi:hypothetical protein
VAPADASNRVDPDDLHELDRLILKESLKQVRPCRSAWYASICPGIGQGAAAAHDRVSAQVSTGRLRQRGAEVLRDWRHLARGVVEEDDSGLAARDFALLTFSCMHHSRSQPLLPKSPVVMRTTITSP